MSGVWFTISGMLLMALMGFGIGNTAEPLEVVAKPIWINLMMGFGVGYLIWAVWDERAKFRGD